MCIAMYHNTVLSVSIIAQYFTHGMFYLLFKAWNSDLFKLVQRGHNSSCKISHFVYTAFPRKSCWMLIIFGVFFIVIHVICLTYHVFFLFLPNLFKLESHCLYQWNCSTNINGWNWRWRNLTCLIIGSWTFNTENSTRNIRKPLFNYLNDSITRLYFLYDIWPLKIMNVTLPLKHD